MKISAEINKRGNFKNIQKINVTRNGFYGKQTKLTNLQQVDLKKKGEDSNLKNQEDNGILLLTLQKEENYKGINNYMQQFDT